jgi:hypothetical protein
MDTILPIAGEALRTLWRDKRLWFFGFFVAAGAGGGGVQLQTPAHGAQLAGVSALLVAALVAGGVVGLVALALHVVSEGALIRQVFEGRAGARPTMADGWRAGLGSAWRVLGVKLLVVLLSALAVGVGAVPVALGVAKLLPTWLGVALGVPLIVVAIPIIITLYLVHEVALRMVVLEGRGVLDALRGGRDFLRGRLAYVLSLVVVDGVVGAASGVVVLPFVMLALPVGVAVYAAFGLVPAVVTAAALLAPVAMALVGARGAFRSTLWTLSFLEERPSLG